MRYMALWLAAAIFIFNVFLDAVPGGPEFTLIFEPFGSAVLSCAVLLGALVFGLPVRLSPVSRIWHDTAFGIAVAGVALVVGCGLIVSAWFATQRATAGYAALMLSGLLSIEFAIIYWPARRRPNNSMKPTAPYRNEFSVFATTPCRGLSLAR